MKARKCVKKFADEMESVLRKNDHKGGWTNITNKQLLKLLKEEVAKLESSFLFRINRSKSIKKEAIDVANFAMMIWDNNKKE